MNHMNTESQATARIRSALHHYLGNPVRVTCYDSNSDIYGFVTMLCSVMFKVYDDVTGKTWWLKYSSVEKV